MFLSADAFTRAVKELPPGARPVLIFDQFEELFTLFEVGPHKDALEEAHRAQAAIVTLLLALLRDHTIPVKLLFVFREDYLAKLNTLLMRCPDLRDQYVRLTLPTTAALPRIVRGPFEEFPGKFERELPPELAVKVEAAIRERAQSGCINLSEVQIVCLALWEAPDPASLLERKGIQGILEEYLSKALNRFPEGLRDPVVAILSRLVTDSGTRNIVSEDDLVRDLAVEETIPPEVSRTTLRMLEVDAKLVRREPRHDAYIYEIVSEFLVPWITSQRNERQTAIERRKAQHAQGLLGDEQRKAAQLRRRLVFAWSLLALLIVAVLMAVLKTVEAKRMQAEAERQKQIVHSHQLAAQAVKYAEDRVDLALLLAREASRKGDVSTGRDSLLAAVAATPKIVSFLRAHRGPPMSLEVSPDRRVLASAGLDQDVYLWSLSYGRLIGPPLRGHQGTIFDLRFSPDGKILASAGEDRTVRLWDYMSGQQIGESLLGHTDVVTGLDFSADGKLLASSSIDGTIRVWDVATRRAIRAPLKGHGETTGFGPAVNSLAFSPDGKTLASGGEDRSILLWDVPSGEIRARLAGHTDPVFKVAFAPGGKLLASGGSGGTLMLWDVTSQSPTPHQLGDHLNAVYDLDFRADGQQLVSGSTDKSITLWDMNTRERIDHSFPGVQSNVYSVAFTDERGTKLASGVADGDIILWAVSADDTVEPSPRGDRGQALRPGWLGRPLTFERSTYALAFSRDAKLIAGTNDGLMWDVEANGFAANTDVALPVHSIAISPDGRVLAAAGCNVGACDEGRVEFWSIETRQRIGRPLRAHKALISSVAFSPDGKTLATGSYDDQILFWDVQTRQARGTPLTSQWGDVNALAFSIDGRQLASGTDQGLVVWDLSQGKGEVWGIRNLVWTVAYSPDGNTLASGSLDSDVSLWDIASRQQRFLRKHRSSVQVLAFTANGATLATGSRDGNVILWDVITGQAQGLPITGFDRRTVRSVAFSPDGNKLAFGADGAAVMLWEVGLRFLQTRACEIAGRNLTEDEWARHFPNETYKATCAAGLVTDADRSALLGERDNAKRLFQEAAKLALAEADPKLHNNVCWYGGLNNFAEIVVASCEQAVKLAPENAVGHYRDSRGVVRALNGDLRGAIEDFNSFVAWSSNHDDAKSLVPKRQVWIDALKQGRNPFDAATLKALRIE